MSRLFLFMGLPRRTKVLLAMTGKINVVVQQVKLRQPRFLKKLYKKRNF